jgi:hypothetical protein
VYDLPEWLKPKLGAGLKWFLAVDCAQKKNGVML